MPLAAYQYRPATPPTVLELPELIEGRHRRNVSGSSWSAQSSPDPLEVHIPTPPDRSPVQRYGRDLLPKLRTQDQSLDSLSSQHKRSLSQPHESHPAPVRPQVQRCTTVPPENFVISPASATSTTFGGFTTSLDSALASPYACLPPQQFRRAPAHARSISASSIDRATLGRYGYPTYRQPPTTQMTGAYWAPSGVPGSAVFTPTVETPIASILPYDLPDEQRFEAVDEPAMSSLEFLEGPNPAIGLCQNYQKVVGRGMAQHYWWDVRNLRTWEDFNLDAIMDVPGFSQLLNMPVPDRALRQPVIPARKLRPESEAGVVEVIRDHYLHKVNATMKVAQGSSLHMAMFVGKKADGPTFLSNYYDALNREVGGNGRGRIVGLVRSYQRWNTGMRAEGGSGRIKYLEGLAHLHHHMRAHQCRYGFLMTETELVCVRAGTDDTPHFGHLELSPVIETRTQTGLTAPLALWYLHMLAKEQPLWGQPGWRLNIGAPAAMTRQRVLPSKDKWIPEPQTFEKRDAKRVRGWIMPSDPFNRKREGKRA